MNETESIITVNDLSRHFGEHKAVNHLNLSVTKGEIFGLVGPDGAGKTTTLRLLAGIMRPTAGTATVANFDVRENPEAIKSLIGYMAQQFSLYGDLTVMENLRFFADIYHVSAAERKQRIPRLLHFSRLERFTKRRAGQLSGGMQKKLGLACTLIHEPELIYLDEPTTGVDPVSRREFWDILGDLHLAGISIVVCTPYMDEAERCSRVGLMYQGKLIVCDTPEQVKGMVEGDLIELRPDNIRRAHALLADLPGVLEVQTYGDLIHVFVQDAEAGQATVTQALEEAGIATSGLRQTHPRMEEAFISLIRRQGMADEAAEALLNGLQTNSKEE